MKRIKVFVERNNVFDLCEEYLKNKVAYDSPFMIRKALNQAKSNMHLKRFKNKQEKNHEFVH
jgi:hypothetical protein